MNESLAETNAVLYHAPLLGGGLAKRSPHFIVRMPEVSQFLSLFDLATNA